MSGSIPLRQISEDEDEDDPPFRVPPAFHALHAPPLWLADYSKRGIEAGAMKMVRSTPADRRATRRLCGSGGSIPVPARYPTYPQRLTRSLDGVWDFCWVGDDRPAREVDPATLDYHELQAVPGVFDTELARRNVRGVGVYRQRISGVTGHLRLAIEGLGLYGRIYWDTRCLGECNTPYTGIEIDFETTPGEHRLHLVVDNRFAPETSPLAHPFDDFYCFGGIYGSVTLQSLPARRVERVAVAVRDLQAGRVRLDIRTAGLPDGCARVRVAFDDAADDEVALEIRDGRARLETTVPRARLWSPDTPHLHTVRVALPGGDAVVERFGIRTVSARGTVILLNGEPLALRGVNRHQSHPQLGPVQPDHLALDDLKLVKALGANFIRCVHYPHAPAFLDLCDQMGLLVWEESFGWGNRAEDARDPRAAQAAIRATANMVSRDINHPSILFWAFLNESCSDTPEGEAWYRDIIGTIRALDDSRLVSYASYHGARDRCFALADVISVNTYPGWIGGADQWSTRYLDQIRPEVERLAAWASEGAPAEKPLLVTEIGACALPGCHDYGRAQWSEEFQADYFREACEAILGNPRFAGLALWQLFDTRTYVNAGSVRTKPLGFNFAGLLDAYRRPKLAFGTVSDCFHRLP